VRAVEIVGRGKSFRVVRYVDKALPPRGGVPDPVELQEALSQIFRKGSRFSRHHVVASLEAHETVVREIPVPFKAEDQIRKVVKYEAEHHLHDCDADDVVVQYTRVGESKEGTRLLVFAARKDDLSRRIEFTRAAGVEPLAMDLDALAVYNAVRAAGTFEEHPDCVLLDIAHRSTEMVFVRDGEVRALRSVRMGVDSIAQGIARDMDIDLEEADHKLHELSLREDEGDLFLPADGALDDKKETEKSHAELERTLFLQKRDEFVARLKREFVRSSAAIRSESGQQKIIATGPGLKVPGLLGLLGDRLGAPLDVFKPSEVFSTKLNGGTETSEFDANSAVVLGLALKGLGQDRLGIDFRREELQVANKFELLKNGLAVTVTLIFLCLMGSSFYFVFKRQTVSEKRFEPLVTKAYQSFSQIAQKYNGLGDSLVSERDKINPSEVELDGPRAEAITRFVKKIQRMRHHLTRKVGPKDGLDPINSALKTWNDIFGIVSKYHKEIGFIDFEKVEIEQDSVTLIVVVPQAESVESLVEGLKEVETLRAMDLEPWGVRPLTGKDVHRNDLQRTTLLYKKKKTRGRRGP
jgi:type IV pilus assembly protein PilM